LLAQEKLTNLFFLYITPSLIKLVTLSFIGKTEKARHIRRFFFLYNQCLAEREIYYLECPSCKSHNQYLGRNHIFVNHAISEWYSLLYRDIGTFGRPELINEERFVNWKNHIREISSQNNIGNSFVALDIGCGEGILGHLLERDGIMTYGIDPSESMIRFAIDELSLPKERYKHGEYCEESYSANFFDVITSYHVIEHTTDPMNFLINAKIHLKKHGLLFVSTPSSKLSLEQFNLTGNSPNFTPLHLFLLSEDWFKAAIEKIGLHIVWEEAFFEEDQPISSSGEKMAGMNYVLSKN
jgi:SAM-dependent methyltransferase